MITWLMVPFLLEHNRMLGIFKGGEFFRNDIFPLNSQRLIYTKIQIWLDK